MDDVICRFCGVRIPLGKSSSLPGVVRAGTNLAHRACVFDETGDRDMGGWHQVTLDDIAHFSRGSGVG